MNGCDGPWGAQEICLDSVKLARDATVMMQATDHFRNLPKQTIKGKGPVVMLTQAHIKHTEKCESQASEGSPCLQVYKGVHVKESFETSRFDVQSQQGLFMGVVVPAIAYVAAMCRWCSYFLIIWLQQLFPELDANPHASSARDCTCNGTCSFSESMHANLA